MTLLFGSVLIFNVTNKRAREMTLSLSTLFLGSHIYLYIYIYIYLTHYPKAARYLKDN